MTVLAKAGQSDGAAGIDVETLEVYCERDMLEAMLERDGPITDLRDEILSLGCVLPRMGP